MATCKDCKKNFGFLELKNGVCKSCINQQTPPCNLCHKNFPKEELTDSGFCQPCFKKNEDRKLEESKLKAKLAKEKEFESLCLEDTESIILTTESDHNLEVLERIEVITAECAFGMNIFKDIFAGVRDIVGGRSKATEGVLKDARKQVLADLKKEAYSLGANAVVGIDLDYSEFSGGGKSMLFVIASGTAVKIKI